MTRIRIRSPRKGFTLIELIIVMSIIATLLGISAGVYFRVMAAQSTATTRTLIQRLDSQLKQQTAYVADRARERSPSLPASQLANNHRRRAEVIQRKAAFKQAFPTSFYEVFNPPLQGMEPYPAYVSHLQQYGITSGTLPAQEHESAACLYMILRVGPQGRSEDELGIAGRVQLASGTGVPYLVDAWNNALVFCRWPTGAVAVEPGKKDPLDPDGWLTTTDWLGTPGATTFASLFHDLPFRASGGGPQSRNLTPLIVSPGRDGQLGLDPQTLSVTNTKQERDNIYSSDLR